CCSRSMISPRIAFSDAYWAGPSLPSKTASWTRSPQPEHVFATPPSRRCPPSSQRLPPYRRSTCTGLCPRRCRVGVQLAAEHAAEQPGLDVDEQAEGQPLAEIGVCDLFLLAFLVSGEDRSAGRGGQTDGAAFQEFEVVRRDLAAVDQAQGRAVAQV